MKSIQNLLQKTVQSFPSQCGVYLMKDTKGNVIYIGKAKNLKLRLKSYFLKEKSFKNLFLTPRIHQVDYILTDTESEAFLLEANLIKKHKPRYNVRLKDDKSYPYIRCSMEDDFPRFYMERRVKKKGSLYFGPYTEVHFARWIVHFLTERFQIRDCNNRFMRSRTLPCMTYQMGRCTAPCVKKVNKEEYRKQIQSALAFLRGKDRGTVKEMEKQMKQLSKGERFEEATKLRNQIKAISLGRKNQSIIGSKNRDIDVVAFYFKKEKGVLFQTLHVRAGSVIGHRFYLEPCLKTDSSIFLENFFSFITQYYIDNFLPNLILVSVREEKNFLFSSLEEVLSKMHEKTIRVRNPIGSIEGKLMEMTLHNAKTRFQEQWSNRISILEGLKQIQEKLHLKTLPERMECFDISHFQGQYLVASQVVFEDGLPKKEDYRKYKIKTVKGNDDFASMREVLSRRLKHKEYPDPGLLIVDGGKGQLQKALLALKEAGRSDIPVVAMAKSRVKADFTAKDVRSSAERFFIAGRHNPIIFPPNSKALHTLVQLRDEAHRFAITYYRQLSAQGFIKK